MNKLIRIWNQNRRGIILAIIVIALLILIIQVLNEMAKQRRLERNEEVKTIQSEAEEELPTESIIGGKELSKQVTKTNVQIIEEFIQKCNKKDVSGAYQMLTDECKEVLYPTEKIFETLYYNTIFTTDKLSNIENFNSTAETYTYRVQFYEDVLSTGKASSVVPYQDYITVNENTNNGKLNINGFISKKEINKEKEFDGIKLIVVSQQIYKEHEDFVVTIENNTDKTILIDSKKNSKSVYILGSNNTIYPSFIREIADSIYEIPSKAKRTYQIKFNKIYNPSISTKGISFSDIILDYEKYKETPEEENKRLQISVSI